MTRVNRLQPDLVALTGDYVGDSAGHAVGMIEPLRLLEAPAYAVYGNHDLWTDRAAVGAALAETPVRLLVNESVEAAAGLTIAGVDDAWSGHPNPQLALADAPRDYTNLLLCHEPDYINSIRKAEAPIALQLSGHSHGGQVRFPSKQPDGVGLLTRAPLLPPYGRAIPHRPLSGRGTSALYEPGAGRLAAPRSFQLPAGNYAPSRCSRAESRKRHYCCMGGGGIQ